MSFELTPPRGSFALRVRLAQLHIPAQQRTIQLIRRMKSQNLNDCIQKQVERSIQTLDSIAPLHTIEAVSAEAQLLDACVHTHAVLFRAVAA